MWWPCVAPPCKPWLGRPGMCACSSLGTPLPTAPQGPSRNCRVGAAARVHERCGCGRLPAYTWLEELCCGLCCGRWDCGGKACCGGAAEGRPRGPLGSHAHCAHGDCGHRQLQGSAWHGRIGRGCQHGVHHRPQLHHGAVTACGTQERIGAVGGWVRRGHHHQDKPRTCGTATDILLWGWWQLAMSPMRVR